jgi:hypothetical protein
MIWRLSNSCSITLNFSPKRAIILDRIPTVSSRLFSLDMEIGYDGANCSDGDGGGEGSVYSGVFFLLLVSLFVGVVL